MSFYNSLEKEKKILTNEIKQNVPSSLNQEQLTEIKKTNKQLEKNLTFENTEKLYFSDKSKGDPFWYKHIGIIFQVNRLSEFFPTTSLTYNEKLNSIFRLTIYISLVLIIIKKNYIYIYIALGGGLFTYLLYKKNIEIDKEHLNFRNKHKLDSSNIDIDKHKKNIPANCSRPNRDNPFMNLLLSDIKYNPEHIACNPSESIKSDINQKFDYNLYRDIGDVFNRDNSQRQYYTTPSTTLPNDQSRFANWLYKIPTSCKSGNGIDCVGLQSPNMNLPNMLWKYTP